MNPQAAMQPFASTMLASFAATDDVVISVVDLDGRVLAGNAGLARIAGQGLDALIDTAIWDVLLQPNDEPAMRDVLAAIGAGAPALFAEHPWRSPDGTLRPMRWFHMPLHDERGVVRSVLGFGHDASLHAVLRARATDAAHRVELPESASDDVFYLADLRAGQLLYASPGAALLWERPVVTLDMAQFLDRVHPNDRPAVEHAWVRQRAGQHTEQEYRLHLPDGRIRWICDRAYPVTNGAGELQHVVGSVRDVTVHREAQDRLADRERLLSAVFNRSAQALWLLSPSGQLLEASEAAHALLDGDTPSHFAELHWATAADRDGANTMLDAAIRGERARRDLRLRSGETLVILDITLQHVPSPTGEVRYLLAEGLDITQRLLDRQERDEAEQRLALAIESISEGVWDWNLADGSAFYSPRWCRNLGYAPGEVTPAVQSWFALVHPEERTPAYEAIQALSDGHVDQIRLEVRLRMRDGDWFWSLARGRVVERDPSGRPIRVVGTDTDIGQIKAVESQIRALNDTLEQRVLARTAELAEASRAKDEFLAVVSHELRTPLMAVLSVAEMVAEGIYGPVTTAQHEALGLLSGSGQHLLELINDLLDLSKLDVQRLPVQCVLVDVTRLLQEVTELTSGLAARTGHMIELSTTGRLGTMEIDAIRVRQVLVNLVSNALKFASAGTVVRVHVSATDDAVAIGVIDQGPGLLEADLPRLFRAFEQLDMRLARKYGGVGLGLSLVHRLTALHGGQVEIASTPNVMTRFTVTLPRTTDIPPTPTTRQGQLLLVGAADHGRARLERWLAAIGFQVGTAIDVPEALGQVVRCAPDVLVIDGDADPLALLAVEALRALPIVVVLTVATARWRAELQSAFGVDAIVEAPVSPEELLAALDARTGFGLGVDT